mgnify:CR=1 FL=1
MATIKENLAKNISELRKINKMTQSELANKLNYTDKAISKWERGESTPDVESLSAIAKLFNLTVDDLLHESFDKEKALAQEKKEKNKTYLKSALGVLTIWLIGTCIFVWDIIQDGTSRSGMWLAFIWPVPISFIFLFTIAFLKKDIKLIPIFASATLWTFLAAVFLQMIIRGEYVWPIFIIGIPIQLIIIITYWINS